MNAIARVHVELSSRCNKSCWMCGRRKLEKARHPAMKNLGDMDPKLAAHIAEQIPPYTVVAFHWNGEALMHPQFGRCVSYFGHCIRTMDTNGKLIVEKANEIIGNLDTITISVIESDAEEEEQKALVKEFLKIKGDRKPHVVFRLLGNVDQRKWMHYPGKIATRVLHDPLGSYYYEKEVTMPESGICQDILRTIAIDRFGNVNHCVRLDPDGIGRIGHVSKATLEEIVNSREERGWHNHPRRRYIDMHLNGERDKVPLCATCEFYGLPTPRIDRCPMCKKVLAKQKEQQIARREEKARDRGD